ncbi:MAG: glycerol-3-phosphate acyltransferase [Asgard group archaeon]|nr:glycerol-3-phosphate acyltransferase [Asgard group archaeon]
MNPLNILWTILALLGAYLSGSIPYSVIIGKVATGEDLRDYNVGNPGGFNAVMTYGYFIGFSVIFIDILKGLIPMILIDQLFFRLDTFVAADGSNIWHTIACILGPAFCILGHNHPVWLKFKGGRGTAVFIGTLLYVNPIVLMTFFIPFGLMIGLLKVPTRVSNILSGIFFIPAGLFIPIAPPYNFIHTDWLLPAGAANPFLYMTPFFITLAMWLAWIPRHFPSLVAAIKGEEWTMSITEGQQITEDFDTITIEEEVEEK